MLVLASQSPRRKEILEKLSYNFICDAVNIDETVPIGTKPELIAEIIAKNKAAAALARHKDCTVIGADTVVVLNGKVLKKPSNKAEAAAMLASLSGKTHVVYTGVSVMSAKKSISFTSSAEVEFSNLSIEEINWYISSGEPMDKAGAYGIQGMGCRFIKKINGDFYTVMGLPAQMLYNSLKIFELSED